METLPIIGSIGALFITTVGGFLWLGLKLGSISECLNNHSVWLQSNAKKINGHVTDHAKGDL